ncbi:hypothetical protein [Thiohalorhabdus sp.]|uniref:hypothetical protein n=1 Tax=Thiohalorhabdus sp. TaxID=3094134 RepID=UPI002FC2D802
MSLDDLLWWQAFNEPTQAGVTGDTVADLGGGLLILALGLVLVMSMALGLWDDRDPAAVRHRIGAWAAPVLVLIYGILMALAVLWLVVPGAILAVKAWNEPLLWTARAVAIV